ncbi:hypothetical protein CAPTEDRAFT_202983 [Capitella teleta]|uniref:Anaphase-promoting complex subunit 4 WD40 domain-containing protein n=1 Tax=Capitella teleta TaxID=283909 RepID=R7TUF0_CAPTE|nr:hypothetical protein CAPTEDRAFT_202983 [Capitella teleta]|eukprot:ELT95096.1 hypothetical protein CAPTEDRAFT_202983 [Capitella teleta]
MTLNLETRVMRTVAKRERLRPYHSLKPVRIRDAVERLSGPLKTADDFVDLEPQSSAKFACRYNKLLPKDRLYSFSGLLQTASRTSPLSDNAASHHISPSFEELEGLSAFGRDRLWVQKSLSSFDIMFDGRVVITAGFDGIISVYDYGCPINHKRFIGHNKGITCIQRSEELIATGSWDCFAKIFLVVADTSENAPMGDGVLPPRHLDCKLYIKAIFGHPGGVTVLCLDKKTNRLITGDNTRRIYVWNTENNTLLSMFDALLGEYHTMDFCPCECRSRVHYDTYFCEVTALGKVLLCGDELTAASFDIMDGSNYTVINLPVKLTCVEWNGSTLVGGTAKGDVIVWDIAEKKIRNKFSEHNDAVSALRVGPDGSLITGDIKGNHVIWKAVIASSENMDFIHQMTHTTLQAV